MRPAARCVRTQTFVTGAAYRLAKRVMPRISPTEAAALEAGTVGFDRDLFCGSPSLNKLEAKYALPQLRADERAFLDGPCEKLCAMIDQYAVTEARDLPQHVWDYMRSEKFFGMIIPKAYGGLGFTAHGHSQVVTKIATRSVDAAVTVMVPNSLGPGELLMRYGTQDQRDAYLPALADGRLIPCFGLTGPPSGSDAAAMRDGGDVVVENGVLGIRATFKKRYITLAPVAGLVGLAIRVNDPAGLLGGTGAAGITVALLERGHAGLRVGDRHDPLVASFMNGTVEGDDVFIPVESVIGGQAQVGRGWNMLMDCLTEGRGISLPALSVAAGKSVTASVGAYSRVREQFKVPLAELEGVQEHLARVGANSLIMLSGQMLTNAMLNAHEQPPVITAILKQQTTERMRQVVNDGMDVLGGAGICRGNANFMAAPYMMVPIAITVEGANTLTRTLIQYGQGLTRSHPHLLDVIKTIQHGDQQAEFVRHVASLVGHGARNAAASLWRSAFRARRFADESGSVRKTVDFHSSQLDRLSAAFALCADVSLLMGGKIKFAEMLSGRYADVMSNLYLGYATLWFASKHANVEGLDVLVEYTMQKVEADIEIAFRGIFANFPVPGCGALMSALAFPLSARAYAQPSDALARKVSTLVSTDSAVRALLAEDMFVPKDATERVALLERALPLVMRANVVRAALRKEKRAPTAAEDALISEAEKLREEIIQVDAFARIGDERQQTDGWTAGDRPAFDKEEPRRAVA